MIILLQKITIHPLLWVTVGIAIVTAHFIELIILLGIVFIHEMGHALMAHFFSWRIRKIQLLPFGGVAEFDEHGNRSAKEEFLVTIAGPIQHVWIAALAFLLSVGNVIPDYLYETIMLHNAAILLFNLLPILPLDGGKLIFLMFSQHLEFLKAHYWSIVSSCMFALLFLIIMLFTQPMNINIWLIFIFLAISLRLEWKQRQYVYVRFLLERYYGKQIEFKKLSPLIVHEDEMIYEVIQRFKRGYKHPIIILRNQQKQEPLDENELLHAYFTEKRTNEPIGNLLYTY
ncbi:stage IV sporulation protein FB [Bacillus sp. HMF5848]|uniref:M50 family metallopeptidase n=1 Tax=Bacillus sp. HMF5848 TaxID=2495421 RepID=UPI000F7B8284|nr:M50 family metallopeptidase [Bacillus sp. HMF5848]RSK29394.1 stage IV sporulation protein FB [Bacillus sp. HMF5848]